MAADKVAWSPAETAARPARWRLAACRCDQGGQDGLADMRERLHGFVLVGRPQLPSKTCEIARVGVPHVLDDPVEFAPAAARAFAEGLPGGGPHSRIKCPPAGFQHRLPTLQFGWGYGIRITRQGKSRRAEVGAGVARQPLNHDTSRWLGWSGESERRRLKNARVAQRVIAGGLQC